jgi:methylenetetrahydrofolate dehydrogenase (NADP+)/methenyltetrahydrofolate cyclohydrolase
LNSIFSQKEQNVILLDGKATAATIRGELKDKIVGLMDEHGRAPGLAVILVGEDPASQVYVRFKEKACAEIGVESFSHRPDADISQDSLMDLIRELNADERVDGILLQLPLPKHLDSQACLDLIDPRKDVDGFHPVSVGKLSLGLPGFRSCTPAGIIELLRRYEIKTSGMKAVVIGRSNIVGKPMSMMLIQKGDYANATTTVCHTRTSREDLKKLCLDADLIVAAAGGPGTVAADMVKDGAVVVDVGMNRLEDGSLCGDVDFENVRHKCRAITPVPGGVGPMTIAQLMLNTVQAFEEHTAE